MKKALTMCLALVMAATIFMGNTASAQEPIPETKALVSIGETGYASLDEAVNEAADGDIITVSGDCTTVGLNLSKNLTIEGASGSRPTITFIKNGISLFGKTLVFKNCDVVLDNVGSTPYSEWGWMTICATNKANITLDHASMLLDGQGMNKHAIYLTGGDDEICLKNQASLTVKNYKQDALEWDGGTGTYNFVCENSSYISDKCRSGFTGTFTAKIINSQVDVVNSLGNGSNGSHFEIQNSVVSFNNNGGHGLSAGKLYVTGKSAVTANENGYFGITANSLIYIYGTSSVTVKKNSKKTLNGLYAAFRIIGQGSTCVIDKGADVTIADNYRAGVQVNTGASMEMNAGVIANNGKIAEIGGGLYNRGTFVMGEDVRIYNNHASVMADDIYNEAGATVTLIDETEDLGLILDDDNRSITGWFFDGFKAGEETTPRWNGIEGNTESPYYYERTKTLTSVGQLALKAAHPLLQFTVTVNYLDRQTKEAIASAYVSELAWEGTEYDVKAYDRPEIGSYQYDGTEGAPLSGMLDGNKIINVYYTKDEVLGDAEEPETTPPTDQVLGDTEAPATGDRSGGIWYIVIGAAAFMAGVSCVACKKRTEKKQI